MTTQRDERTDLPADAAKSLDGAITAGLDRLPRCCDHHPNWPTLAQHVLDAFPTASIDDVVCAVRDAKAAVDHLQLQDDEIDIAELMVRYRLMVTTGQLPDAARLDPERHGHRPR